MEHVLDARNGDRLREMEKKIKQMEEEKILMEQRAHKAEALAAGAEKVIQELENTIKKQGVIYGTDRDPFALPPASGSNTSSDVTHAHAVAITVSARREHLSELPKFKGDGVEWLHFKHMYEHTRDYGCFTNLEMKIKLQQALKGAALRLTRHLLNSPSTQADKIMAKLEIYFFDKRAIRENAYRAITSVPPLNGRDREATVHFERLVSTYIIMCEDTKQDQYCRLEVSSEVLNKLPFEWHCRWNEESSMNAYENDYNGFAKFLWDRIRFTPWEVMNL